MRVSEGRGRECGKRQEEDKNMATDFDSTGWGVLFDQPDAVFTHVARGVEFLERIGSYVKERAQIEEEYAAKLRGLVKKSLGSKKKDEEEAFKHFSALRGFVAYLKEADSVAAQHEVVAERFRKDVLPFVATRAQALRQARKMHLGEYTNMHANMKMIVENMGKEQKNYSKAFKEAEAALLKFQKAEKNMEISRLDLEKARANSSQRHEACESAKKSYAHAVQSTNMAQDDYYGKQLPGLMEHLRTLDEERVKDSRAALELATGVDKEVHSIIGRCNEDMLVAIGTIDPKTDSAAVADLLKTGYGRPAPFQMEELGAPDGYFGGDTPDSGVGATLKRGVLGSGGKKPDNSKTVSRKHSVHQKLFGNGNDKHKHENNSDYMSYPPQQRARRLQAKIEQLKSEQTTTLESHKACLKMQTMGNPADCDAKLAEFAKKAQELGEQIARYEALLEEAKMQCDSYSAGDRTPPSSRSSHSDHAPPRPAPPQAQQSHSHSAASHNNHTNGNNNEDYAVCQTPALGTCTVLYTYDGSSGEATMKVNEGDEMLLIERDEGDGWTRVRSLNGDKEGFVPTSYLECKWYPE